MAIPVEIVYNKVIRIISSSIKKEAPEILRSGSAGFSKTHPLNPGFVGRFNCVI